MFVIKWNYALEINVRTLSRLKNQLRLPYNPLAMKIKEYEQPNNI